MDIKQLRYFQKIAEYENISKAAAEPYISQPALTKSLRQLELELNTELFDRYAHKIELNETGRLTLAYTERILQELDELYNQLGKTAAQSKPLSIRTTQSFVSRYLLPAFRVEYPQLQVQSNQF